MFIHPNIDPVAISLGPLKVHWYGIMYLVGFALAWALANYRIKHLNLNWQREEVADLIFFAALGIIAGGRIGYMLFYNFSAWLHQPIQIFKIWEGGMSFHGGLIGVIIALYLFAQKFHKSFLEVADFTAPLVPLGLAAGRIGNFINGELWGKPTMVKWAMIFPQLDNLPRHPSQIYEFCLEGIGLFLILFFYSNKPRRPGCVMAIFLIFYGIFRFIIEFYRQPDVQLGYIFNFLTMGQLLSLPMLCIGMVIYFYQKKHAKLS